MNGLKNVGLTDILKWFCRWVLMGCLVLLGSVKGHAQVVINEVMFDPLGSEFFDEYIELYNVGDVAVNLQGWRIGDGDETNRIIGLTEGLVLKAGQYALILDAEYHAHSTHYHPLPTDILLLTVDSATLGRNGLSNATSEKVVLLNAQGDTVGAMVYVPGNAAGYSEEKIDPAGGDGAGNWADAKWAKGTPGSVNSVSQKDRDLTLKLDFELPIYVPWGEVGSVNFWVVNRGKEAIDRFHVIFQEQELVKGPLSAGDSIEISAGFAPVGSGPLLYGATVFVAGDQDTTNNVVTWTVVGGTQPGHVVIGEVMAKPEDGTSEWIEIQNRTAADIDLSGWSLQDNTAVGYFSDGVHLPSGQYALIVENAATMARFPTPILILSLSRWPRLNDGGDVIELRDATKTVIDRVVYPDGAVQGVSLERIDVARSGEDAQNWLASTSATRSTPGADNSVKTPDVQTGVSLLIDPNPFDEQTTITYQLPVDRATVNLWVYDRLGRRVKTLLFSAEGGGQRQVIWNGRDDQEQVLKPGLYVLYLEAGTKEGAVWRVKETVVLSRGL